MDSVRRQEAMWMSCAARDALLRSLLDAAGVSYAPLADTERAEAERQWREVYGQAFGGRCRMRYGSRADYEYAQQAECRWLIVPLSARVEATPVSPYGPIPTGYACEGLPVPLGAACALEFAVAPTDLSWTMLYTHEDHEFGGPYFIRCEWLTALPDEAR